jgi:glutathione S-transferase
MPVDGGCWQVDARPSLEPMIPVDADLARREAARRTIQNHVNIVRFACRANGKPGAPSVNAPLADPYAVADSVYEPAVDSALRQVCSWLLLEGGGKSSELAIATEIKASLPIPEINQALLYLRDRVGCPRDMSIYAAKQYRSYINHLMQDLERS